MRVAALYDIHGNLAALEAVLQDVRRAGADQIVVGGDVLPGLVPHETREAVACLRALDIPARFIIGNGDREVLAVRRGIETAAVPEAFREIMRWNAAQLEAEDERWIDTWPATLRMQIPGVGGVLFCHATPRSDTEIFTAETPDEHVAPMLEGVDDPLVVCGHTHVQFDRAIGSTRVVNAGSVGMPFGEPGAFWLLVGPGIQLRRTAF
jgi:predicted phosphodiesterase